MRIFTPSVSLIATISILHVCSFVTHLSVINLCAEFTGA
jgi:hypothetical protein